MQVSAYLDPVIETALEHADTIRLHADTNVNVTVRERLNDERKTALEDAWTRALTLARTAEASAAIVDEDWPAWERQGENTAAYKAWRASSETADTITPTETAALTNDTLITDTAAPDIRHPDRITINLQPAVIDLDNPTVRPGQLTELAAFARARLANELERPELEQTPWQRWRRAGGDTRPEYQAWLEERRRNPRPPVAPSAGVAVQAPARPTTAPVTLRPGLLIPPVPAAGDIVTGLEIRYRVIGTAPPIPAEDTAISAQAFTGATAYTLTAAFPRATPEVRACVYYTAGTDTISRVDNVNERGNLIGTGIGLDVLLGCAPPRPGEDAAEHYRVPPVTGQRNWPAGQPTVYVKPKAARVPQRPTDIISEAEIIPYDGSAAAWGRHTALTVAARSQSAGIIETRWINAIGTGPPATGRIDDGNNPPERFAPPGWVSVAVDDDVSPRVQQAQIAAAVQYQTGTGTVAGANRAAITIVITENRGDGTAWETFAAVSRATPHVRVTVPSIVRARRNTFNVTYRAGAATLLTAAKALPQLASFTVTAAPDPFPIFTG